MRYRILLALLAIFTGQVIANPAHLSASNEPPSLQTLGDQGLLSPDLREEVVMYTLGLLNVGYKFGGDDPGSGLDCSGMVAYVFHQATGTVLPHHAASIARLGRHIAKDALQPGDLVFFNTRGAPFTHMGIYLGDDRFVHAPNRNGRVRVDSLSDRYYTKHFESGRSLFSTDDVALTAGNNAP